MRWVKRSILTFFRIVGVGGLLYLMGNLTGALIPANTQFQQDTSTHSISIYVRSNGFHSFLILPVESPPRNWRKFFDIRDFNGVDSSYSFISFGWGDKGFFMETPTWADFSGGTALTALFLPSPSVMQVQFLSQRPIPNRRSIQLQITPDAYQELCTYLDAALISSSNRVNLIPGKGYTGQDNFYEANGTYSLLYTCNNWVNSGLKSAGIRSGIWTPTDRGLFYQLHKNARHEEFQ